MKIAQVATLFDRIPPNYAGGTERIVSYLTEELVRRGQDVTLFASGDSETSAKLVAACSQSLKATPRCTDQIGYHVLLAEQVFKRASDFDIIHNHTEYFPYSLARRHQTPMITTLHWSLDSLKEDWEPLYREFADMRVVSISNAQRKPFPWLNWQGTVYHGFPNGLYTLNDQPGRYLAFLARLEPQKGVRTAIEIAVRAGMELRIAGNIHQVEYFKQIEPLFKHPLINYIGEIHQEEKNSFLGNAYALLFPVDVQEAFGMVMAEAMACGTPVIARDRGAVREVIEDGVNGFVIETVHQAVKALENVPSISRKRCRQSFEERFSDSRMVDDYLAIYLRALDQEG